MRNKNNVAQEKETREDYNFQKIKRKKKSSRGGGIGT